MNQAEPPNMAKFKSKIEEIKEEIEEENKVSSMFESNN